MNVSILSAAEVLRMCQPVTDLERRLFEITQELQFDLDDERQKFPPEYEDDDCDECDNKMGEIEDAISFIESGKVDEALKKLKSIA